MIEKQQELWSIDCDVICITTNGTVKKDGSAVMGRGCALEAREKFRGIDKKLGSLLKVSGNGVYILENFGKCILSFPVKHNWDEMADINLIEKSLKSLVRMVDFYGWKIVALPRPGCGNGGLNWDDVKPILQKYLDDRFIIVNK